MSLLAVYTTVATQSDAQTMAHAIITQRLAACVHIVAIESVYRWDGAVQQESEWRLMCKTTTTQYAALAAAIRQLHTYTLPAIYALPIVQSDPEYADWVTRSVIAAS